MRVYVAGPLFSEAERAHLDRIADRLEAEGFTCFVPHRQVVAPLTPARVLDVDLAGIRSAAAVVAWLDGPMVDDGTACEVGIFSEMVRRDPSAHRGIVGIATDWRLERARDAGMPSHGLNHFLVGVIEDVGEVVWSVDDAVAVLRRWAAGER